MGDYYWMLLIFVVCFVAVTYLVNTYNERENKRFAQRLDERSADILLDGSTDPKLHALPPESLIEPVALPGRHGSAEHQKQSVTATFPDASGTSPAPTPKDATADCYEELLDVASTTTTDPFATSSRQFAEEINGLASEMLVGDKVPTDEEGLPLVATSAAALADDIAALDEALPNIPQPTRQHENIVSFAQIKETSEQIPEIALDELPLPADEVSDLCHSVTKFVTPEGVLGKYFLLSCREYLLNINKPFAVYALDNTVGKWQVLSPLSEQSYRHFAIALLLADRNGLISEDMLGVVQMAMQKIADNHMAAIYGSGRRELFHRGKVLDQFCEAVDVQIVITVVPKSETPFAGVKAEKIALDMGLQRDPDHQFSARDIAGRLKYRLINHDAVGFNPNVLERTVIHGLSFLLDVPRTLNPAASCDEMFEGIIFLTKQLDGKLVDDQRNPINPDQKMSIVAYVKQIEKKMKSFGITAGSTIAKKVFD